MAGQKSHEGERGSVLTEEKIRAGFDLLGLGSAQDRERLGRLVNVAPPAEVETGYVLRLMGDADGTVGRR
jgi:hypothetical protein